MRILEVSTGQIVLDKANKRVGVVQDAILLSDPPKAQIKWNDGQISIVGKDELNKYKFLGTTSGEMPFTEWTPSPEDIQTRARSVYKPKIYVAGKITDDINTKPQVVLNRFERNCKGIRRAGYIPVNPLEVVNNLGVEWTDAMKMTIPEMLKCDAVYVIPGFEGSRGTSIEIKLANDLLIPVFFDFDILLNHFMLHKQRECSHPSTHLFVDKHKDGSADFSHRCDWCNKKLS